MAAPDGRGRTPRALAVDAPSQERTGRARTAHTSAREACDRAGWADGGEEGKLYETLSVTLADKRDCTSATLFQLEPLYFAEGAVRMEEYFRIRHINSGHWIHLVRLVSVGRKTSQRRRLSPWDGAKLEQLTQAPLGAWPVGGEQRLERPCHLVRHVPAGDAVHGQQARAIGLRSRLRARCQQP